MQATHVSKRRPEGVTLTSELDLLNVDLEADLKLKLCVRKALVP